MKKALVILFIIFLIILSVFYLSFVFVFPKIVNSSFGIKKVENIFKKITGFNIKSKNLNLKVNLNLSSTTNFDEIIILNANNSQVLKLKKGKIKNAPFKIKPYYLSAEYIFLDSTKFNSKNKKEFNLDNLAMLDIKKFDILFQNNKKYKSSASFENIKTKNENKIYYINFFAIIKSNLLKEDITAGKSGQIYIKDKEIYLEDYVIKSKNSAIALDGIIYSKSGIDFILSCENFSMEELEKIFLFIMKQKQKDKNFIENFYDFKGLCDINLNFKQNAIFGYANLKNFGFKSVKLSVPFYYERAKFNFSKDKIEMITKGKFAKEDLYTDFYAFDLFKDSRIIKGKLISNIGDSFAKEYLPDTKIKNRVDLKVKYFIQYRKPEVEYFIDLKKGSDISYKNIKLALIDKKRKIYGKTIKIQNNLYLKEYKYMKFENDVYKIVFSGFGQFLRKNSKLHLIFINAKTNDWITSEILGLISDIIPKGLFRGNVTYFYQDKKLIGNFEIKDSIFKDYYIKNAKVVSTKENIKIKAKGEYQKSPFECLIDMQNKLDKEIFINYLDLYLKEYEIKKKINKKAYKTHIKKRNYTIKKAVLRLDKLKYNNIIFENMTLKGLIKNHIAYFSMPDILFANGTLEAEGIYNFDYNSSNINFKAYNVDSNKTAEMVFDLKDQFEGKLSGRANLKTFDNLKKIKGKINFIINNGALKKIGQNDFLLKDTINKENGLAKFIRKHTNLNSNKMQSYKSDIYGGVELFNTQAKNIELFSKNDMLSLYLKGNYNISNKNSNLCLYIRYNKDLLNGIKIFHIPASWIVSYMFKKENSLILYKNQIDKIPKIQNSKKQEILKVMFNGNINNFSIDKKNLKILN